VELRQIKELMAAMRRYRTRRVVYEKNGFKLELEQEGAVAEGMAPEVLQHTVAEMPGGVAHYTAPFPAGGPGERDIAKGGGRPPESAEEAPSVEEDAGSAYVSAPIVGTFYQSSSPGEDAFVKVGDVVHESTVVCIIEAMKVMNEVKAGCDGVVEKVLVEDGHPVEFGAQLFQIAKQG